MFYIGYMSIIFEENFKFHELIAKSKYVDGRHKDVCFLNKWLCYDCYDYYELKGVTRGPTY
jgi:hypothetical protein